MNDTYFSNDNSGKKLYWTTFVFLFTVLFSGIVLIVPGVETLLVTPNVINFSVAAIILIIVLFRILINSIKYKGLVISFGFIALYFGYLFLSSIWSQYPDLTITALKFDLLNLFSFSLFYLFSLNNKIKQFNILFIFMAVSAIIMTVISYTINHNLSRVGYGMFVSLAGTVLLFEIYSGERKKKLNYLLLVLIVVSLIVSMQKTAMLSFFIGAVLITIIPPKKRLGNVIRAFCIFVVFVILFPIIFFTNKDIQKLSLTTYARVSGNDVSYGDIYIEGELKDETRTNIFEYANELLKDNWLLGIGYMNFAPKYAMAFNSPTEITFTGKEVSGMSIHSMFQAWILEGGIFLVIIVFFLLLRYFKILKQQIKLSKNKNEVYFYKMLMVIMIQLLVTGLYHQVHATSIFWMMLGFVFALKYKVPFQDSFSNPAAQDK